MVETEPTRSLKSAVAYGSFTLQCFKSQFKRGFAKVVVTRAGRSQEWSQGELRLYLKFVNEI